LSRYENRKNRLSPFVPVLIDILDCPAWRAVSLGARVLYVALRRRYYHHNHNNGRIYLSQRDAAKEVGSHHNQIARWFGELQHFGFIVMMTPGFLGLEGRGKATRWRLTELGYMKDLPTQDYKRWGGQPFIDKKKTRAGKQARGVRESRHNNVPGSRPQDATLVPEMPHISQPASVQEITRRTSLPLGSGAADGPPARTRTRIRITQPGP
jgi:hypothetical protein